MLSCVFSLVAKRSILGFVFSCQHMLLNVFSQSFHAVWTSFFQDSMSASVFCISGMCVAESQFSRSCAHDLLMISSNLLTSFAACLRLSPRRYIGVVFLVLFCIQLRLVLVQIMLQNLCGRYFAFVRTLPKHGLVK